MSKSLINIQRVKLSLHVLDDEVTFNVFKAMKYPIDNEDCFHIDIMEKLTIETFREGILCCCWKLASSILTPTQRKTKQGGSA